MDNAVECLRPARRIAKPVNDDLLEHSKRAAEQYSLREQIRRHTEHLEELVASRTRELLEAHRVAVVGETVACMAHTIKNLAAALEGSLFVLKQGMESGNREYLDDGWAMLEEDISRVRDKLLHLLRIGQQTELRECLVDPVQPVRHVVKRLEGRAASLSIALQFQDAADSDPIPLDAERLEGCLLNLVLEAFPAPGLRARPAEVRVEIARTPDALIYDVRDNGTGLSAEAAERLRDGLFTTKKDGTGFGLLGTRKALLEMGGRLLWENLPDSGALFRIVLPLRVERTPAAAEANHLREDS
ncbi:MAG: ATP-binding protein [Bilophila wadsworthia]